MNGESESRGNASRSDDLRTQPLTTVTNRESSTSEIQSDSPVLVGSRYKLIEVIARGGMGIIFRARDVQLCREVAIKVLRADRADNLQARNGFDNEARIMSYLSHPGVTPIYECGACQDLRPFYVMKLVGGTTLADLLRSGTTETSHLLSIFADICQTMAFAHSRGVLHLDLKPGNVMVGEFGEVHVMDWGLARFTGPPPAGFDEASSLPDDKSPKSVVNGTPEYMSPEQACGRTLDTRADVFSLGSILCEILIGHAPYEGSNVRQVYAQAVKVSMKSALNGLDNSQTDRTLVRLAKQCMAKSRRDRPRSAIEVAQAMSAYQETALERMESDMNRFFELSLDMFCIAGIDGFFRRINSNFSRVLGHCDSELLSRPFIDFVHPDDIADTINQMSVLGEGKSVVRFRNRYRTASGKYKTLEWMAKGIEGESLIFAVARDVS